MMIPCYRAQVETAYNRAAFPVVFQKASLETRDSFIERVRILYDALNEAYNDGGVYQLRVDDVSMEVERVDAAFEVEV